MDRSERTGTDKAVISRREVLAQAAGAALAGPLLLSRTDRAVGASKAAGKRPNILLIMTDQQRGDSRAQRPLHQRRHDGQRHLDDDLVQSPDHAADKNQ